MDINIDDIESVVITFRTKNGDNFVLIEKDNFSKISLSGALFMAAKDCIINKSQENYPVTPYDQMA